MSDKLKQESVYHRLGSRSGHKGKAILTNNESLHSHHMTRVLGVVLGVAFDGDTYVTKRATVWPKVMKIKSTCIIVVYVGIPINCQRWISFFGNMISK